MGVVVVVVASRASTFAVVVSVTWHPVDKEVPDINIANRIRGMKNGV